MLKRVLVIGDSERLFDAACRVAAGKDMEIICSEGTVVPPAAVAVGASSAKDIGKVIETAARIGDGVEGLLFLLAHAIDCREEFQQDTSKRVMEHATRFAAALSLPRDQQLTLEHGALVRDIGKIRVPTEVLLKDVLTYDEWTLLQKHSHLGADLIKDYAFLEGTADILRCHHECFDGDGYPEKLEGEAIPFLARIMKLLDAYCAMTSPRRYRKGVFTHDEVVDYLRKESGKHFDPELVRAFIEAEVWKAGV